eukprot:scaffold260580_cov18-Tisochrysis_lutea.AAC.1
MWSPVPLTNRGLDRIDQEQFLTTEHLGCPVLLDPNSFVFIGSIQAACQPRAYLSVCAAGTGVHVYVLDTGIMSSHQQFEQLDEAGLPTGKSRVDRKEGTMLPCSYILNATVGFARCPCMLAIKGTFPYCTRPFG